MKRILLVNNNLKVGGVQKSLCNLLWALADRHQITLLLFAPVGPFREQIPANVQMLGCDSLFRYLGISQGDCSGLRERLTRALLAGLCRLFGRQTVMKLILPSQKPLTEEYDAAIAFLHNGSPSSFYGGVQEFVLEKVSAGRKIAFLHGDHRRSGANCPQNNALLSRFDRIAACSCGCRRSLLAAAPGLEPQCITVKNFHRFDHIRTLASEEAPGYGSEALHILMVTRLAPEKAVHRAIRAVNHCQERGLSLRLHIVGDGKCRAALIQEAAGLPVTFYGEQVNPYPFMARADLLLITSYHEAAPMIVEEARCLELPVLTVKTASSQDQVGPLGWECENSQTGINEALFRLCSGNCLGRSRHPREMNNDEALAQFEALLSPPEG